MSLNDQLAKEVIRERSHPRVTMRRPAHPRAARMLRKLAERFDEPR